jgi:hypothetical protein
VTKPNGLKKRVELYLEILLIVLFLAFFSFNFFLDCANIAPNVNKLSTITPNNPITYDSQITQFSNAITGYAMADGSVVLRQLSAPTVEAGKKINVTLNVIIGPDLHTYYLIEETFPAGWTLTESGGGGSAGNMLRWFYLNDTERAVNTRYTYEITAPANAGTYSFSGLYWIEGMANEANIEGTNSVTVTSICTPVTEVCDGIDNDCDGQINEGLTAPVCGLTQGVCAGKLKICGGAPGWLTCNATIYGSNYEISETRCDTLDNDCDGNVDEGCQCTSGSSRACGTDIGICTIGVQLCVASAWGPCNGSTASTEVCDDDLDNDCDGNVDESCSAGGGGGSGSGGGGSSGGSGSVPSGAPISVNICKEEWKCSEFGICTEKGLRFRTCTDQKNCGTAKEKPDDVEICKYEGSCSDGLKNGNEEGIDCGNACGKECAAIPESKKTDIGVTVEPIKADILDIYEFSVKIKNFGSDQLENIRLSLDKWTDQTANISFILPGDELEFKFLLALPDDVSENSLAVEVFYKDAVIKKEDVPVYLSIPDYSLKVNVDSTNNKIYSVLIIDNRNETDKHVGVEYSINKKGETYYVEPQKVVNVNGGKIFQKMDSLPLKSLPSGSYEVIAAFYEDGKQVSKTTTYVTIPGQSRGFSLKYLFYIITTLIIFYSLFIYYKMWKER